MPAILLDMSPGYAIADAFGRPLCARIFGDIEEAEAYAEETGLDLISYDDED